jgi:hypothetical protein
MDEDNDVMEIRKDENEEKNEDTLSRIRDKKQKL